MSMQYDDTLRHGEIDYAFVHGDHRIVFIKTGLGGDCFGNADQYLHMAHMLHRKQGCSVIVAANPNDGKRHVPADRQVIEQYMAQREISTPALYLFGNSNGCIKGLALATEIPFVRMVLVNMPLMIDFHKTKRCISAIMQTEIIAVYGDRDPSAPYIPFLDGRFENLQVRTIAGADHNFSGMQQEFADLSDCLLQ